MAFAVQPCEGVRAFSRLGGDQAKASRARDGRHRAATSRRFPPPAGRDAVLVAAGLFFLGLGVLHYLSFRNAGEVLAFGWLGVGGGPYPWSGLLTPRCTGLAYFLWASFPCFAAAACTPLLVSPLFARREAARLSLASFAVYASFEAGQWLDSAFTATGLAGSFDALDMAALALGSLSAFTVLRLLPNGREHD